MEKTPKQKAEDLIVDIVARYIKDAQSFEDAINGVALDIRETMRSIAVGSGALAAAALVLLSSGIKADISLVLIGIVTLLTESAAAFVWLIHVQTLSGKKMLAQRRETLGPASKILLSHHDYREGKKSEQIFFKELNEYIEDHNKRTDALHAQELIGSSTNSIADKVFAALLIFGVLSLTYGLITPHLPQNTWYNPYQDDQIRLPQTPR